MPDREFRDLIYMSGSSPSFKSSSLRRLHGGQKPLIEHIELNINYNYMTVTIYDYNYPHATHRPSRP